MSLVCRNGHQPGFAFDQAVDGKHLQQARRCHLVVFGVEVSGRVSRGALTFLRLLARATVRQRAGGAQWPLDKP